MIYLNIFSYTQRHFKMRRWMLRIQHADFVGAILIQPMAGVKMADFESHWVKVARRSIKCDTFFVTSASTIRKKSVAFYIALWCNMM